MASVSERLLTIEEFAALPASRKPQELVRGRIVEQEFATPIHGKTLARVGSIIDEFVEQHELGFVASGRCGVMTRRNPDSLRGADVAFYSYTRMPKNTTVWQYPDVSPEIVFEVRSPSDRWADVLEKVAEYLKAGVLRVCVLDLPSQTVRVYTAEAPEEVLQNDQELPLPELHAEFRVAVSRLFP